MFLNFIKVTLRTLYREKVYAIINIAGLSIAIACCVIIGLWLKSEFTYEMHNSKYSQIYRVENEFTYGPEPSRVPQSPILLGPMLAKYYSEIKGFARIADRGKTLVSNNDKSFYWNSICWTEQSIFDLFDYKVIYGNIETALTEPFTAAVSETFAKKYFGDKNPIDENIRLVSGKPIKITLVFADIPENSHLRYDVLVSYEFMKIPDDPIDTFKALTYPFCYTFLLMPENYNIKEFDKISDAFYKKYMNPNVPWKGWLSPLADVHFNSESFVSGGHSGNIFYVYGFAGVGIFILLVACINYMNLATARAAKRAREIGVRKALGSGKLFLVLQFLGEAVFFSIISMFLGLMLAELALTLSPVNQLLEKSLSLNLINGPELLGWMIMFSLGLGIMAGIYPAFYLSSILPPSVLVTNTKVGKGNIYLRQMLVMIQFVISIGIIACTIIMALQMRYCSNKSLGFNKENRVVISMLGANLADKVPLIKKELSKNGHILGMTLCNYNMADNVPRIFQYIENNDKVIENTHCDFLEVDNDFINVMGLEMVTGRKFSKELMTDADTSLIVNETLVKQQGWEQPLGKRIEKGKVIGVVKDFHVTSLHQRVSPLIIQPYSKDTQSNYFGRAPEMAFYYLIVNLEGKDMSKTIAYLKKKLAEFDSRNAFEYRFLDDTLDQLYWSEERAMKLVGTFSTLCVFISCLGLFGLASFTTEQRTKEIGVRKVLGASTLQITTMLARNILFFILLGGIIASLAAYYTMDEWLTSFAYKINIEPWVFLVSILIVAAVAFITVVLQSLKTAQANPVKALRYE